MLPNEIQKLIDWDLSVKEVNPDVVVKSLENFFYVDKKEMSKFEAWRKVNKLLRTGQWRKFHTLSYWVWYCYPEKEVL